MIIRSKAPLRIGLAGGGSDLSPYADVYGGAILNATLNMYAFATIQPRNDNKIKIHAADIDANFSSDAVPELEIDDSLVLHKGIYNRIVKERINSARYFSKEFRFSGRDYYHFARR